MYLDSPFLILFLVNITKYLYKLLYIYYIIVEDLIYYIFLDIIIIIQVVY
jgi:hypothetical protein